MRIKILLLFIFGASILQGQTIKFGKISPALISSMESELEPDAVAAYIYSKCRIQYDFSPFELITEYHYRIKIYKEEGEKYANFEIPFYDEESIRYVDATSYNEENGRIIATKLDRKNIYVEETSEKWNLKKFAIPNVKPGTVIELKYTFISSLLNQIPQWYFQHKIPSIKSEYVIIVPKYFELTPVPSGTIEIERNKKDYFSPKHGEVVYTFSANDVPSLKDDEYVLNIDDYRSGIKYEISKVNYPGGRVENYASSWKDIAGKLFTDEKFGRIIKKRLKDLDFVVNKALDVEGIDRIKYVHNYLIENYTWNKYIGIHAEKGLNKLLKEKTGNIADLNLLLINLLQKAGVDAKPVVLKTRSSGILNTNFPSIRELNYVVALVELNGKKIFLDASSRFIPIGQLPIRATNIEGILIDEKEAAIIQINNPNKYSSQIFAEYELFPSKNLLKGVVKSKKSNYAAIKSRIDIDGNEEEDNDAQHVEGGSDQEENDVLEGVQDERKITNVENQDDIYKAINTTFDESLYSVSRIIEGDIFIDAALNYGIEENPFTEDERKYPIFYNYKIDLKRVISIVIPDGYTMSSKPENMAVSLGEKEAQFIYEVKLVQNKIFIYYTFKVNKDIFYGDQFESLKEFYDMIIKKQGEKIVFTKT